MGDPSTVPVLLLHGMGSSFEHNWRAQGWVDILEDAGREVIPVHLPGHGGAARLREGESAAQRLLEGVGSGPVDAVGFSAGAAALYEAVVRSPQVFRRVALLGIGDGMIAREQTGLPDLADAVESADEDGGAGAHALMARILRQTAGSAGNEIDDVIDYIRRMPPPPGLETAAAQLRGRDTGSPEVLLVTGELDAVGPVDQLVDALGARSLVLPKVDHFATTTSFACQAAVLDFLSADGPQG